jgi:hypothetical protein
MKMLAILMLGATLIPSAASAATSRAAGVDSSPITRGEAVARADRLFELLDMNRDGLLTKSEAQTEGAKLMAVRFATGKDIAPGIGGHTLTFFKRALAGGPPVDRSLFERTMLAHFDEMDSDHDGLLTADERAAGRKQMERGG